MKVHVERMEEGWLARSRWCFELVADWGRKDLVLEEYHEEHRETRQKRTWAKDKVYLRVGDTRPYVAKVLTSDEVPIPADVEAELRKHLVDFVSTVPITRKRT